MKNNHKIIINILFVFLILCAVSLYRQLSSRYLPNDIFCPYIVYIIYTSLLCRWLYTIRIRITQRNIKHFLYAEIALMIFLITLRFCQDAFLYVDTYVMRVSGYFVNIPLVFVPLMGLYASFGFGKSDDYSLPRKWLLLYVPAVFFALSAVTNEYHHLNYYVLPDEVQPNLYFHLNIMSYLIIAWGIIIISSRTAIFIKRNNLFHNSSHLRKIIPYLEVLLFAAFIIPYAASSFWVNWELVEFTAGMIFFEVVCWESYIYLGLVPVNNDYNMVFDMSSIAMQITDTKGNLIIGSSQSSVLSQDVFKDLLENGTLYRKKNVEMHLYRMSDCFLIWEEDISVIQNVIGDLQKSVSELEQETTLLAEEVKTRSEEASVNAKNEIYDILTSETSYQINMLSQLLESRDTDRDMKALYKKIATIGTYVKRRCNLRLIDLESHNIRCDDLLSCFTDMTSCLRDLGIETELKIEDSPVCTSDYLLFIFDLFESVIEHEDFKIDRIMIMLYSNSDFTLEVSVSKDIIPYDLKRYTSMFETSCISSENGYVVSTTERK
jgi:hypothetical protein